MATSASAIWQAIADNAPRDHWIPLQDLYDIVSKAIPLQPDDFQPDAPGSEFPRWQRNVRNVLQARKGHDLHWSGHATYRLPSIRPVTQQAADAETRLRRSLLDQLTSIGGPLHVSPDYLRDLGIYGGAQGVWIHKTRTAPLTSDGKGITVALLHTGEHYPDDLSEGGLIYHYPETSRPSKRDLLEVDATKNAALAGIPIFVITQSPADPASRDVHLAWVAGWDDEASQFLVLFQEAPPPDLALSPNDDEPFSVTQPRTRRPRTGSLTTRAFEFRFRVLQRYGARCAVCDISIINLLDAVHIIPVEKGGSDDPRNGLVLCATHHRAFDALMFGVEATTLSITLTQPYASDDLRLTRSDLSHLARFPHRKALSWRAETSRTSPP